MDGVHDMGGMHGFGPVVEPDGEADLPRSLGAADLRDLHMLLGPEELGAGPGGRPVREEMDPADYLAASYYERWLLERRAAAGAQGHDRARGGRGDDASGLPPASRSPPIGSGDGRADPSPIC